MATSKTISVSPGWSGGNTWVDLYAQVHSVTRDAAGNITAITTDTMHINELSSQLLSEIARAADSEKLDIRIPLGSLLGSNL